MADGVELNPGTGGDTVASDDISGQQYQRTKLTLGADGVNDGDVADGNPLPVKPRAITWNAPTFVSVGIADTIVLTATAARKGAVFVNDSTNVIYLGIGAAAVVSSGIRLNPLGGAYEINAENLNVQAINAIATAAASNLTVHEAV